MSDAPDIPPFITVVVLGISVFGLFFIASQANGSIFDVSTEEPDQRMIFEERNPGTVGQSNPDHRTIQFEDFTVGEARGSIKAYSRTQQEISDRLFGGEQIWFDYNATQPEGGNITFEVLGREGRGEVYVDVNGERIFEEYLVSSGSPEIEIPKNELSNGMNRFEIGVNRQSFLGSSKFVLEDIEAEINDRKFHDYTDNFQIYQYELEDYVESPLTFQVSNSVKTSPLKVYINDQEVYSKAQVRAEESVQINPQNADLHTGSNTIRFETDSRPAQYTIENTQITMRYVGNSQSESVLGNFGINQSGLRYAQRDDTSEYITFNYQNLLPSPREMHIQLNDFTTTITPTNGQNRINFSASELGESNYIAIQSRGTYQMNNLRVESVRGE
jgi:hypothetical protein